jgi:glycosyltransferase involved in cell wall biosynthesis
MVDREEREYELADRIVVLSNFARDGFLAQGVPPEKVRTVASGVRYDIFAPHPGVLEERVKRITSGAPLRVLFVGLVCHRKGLHDYVEVVERLKDGPFSFRIVGNVTRESVAAFALIASHVQLQDRVFEFRLPDFYSENDLFFFPTIEDGYPAVLAQATVNGLPVITTPNGSGPDIIQEGRTGWILPIRRPDLFIERLLWCHEHRTELAEMAVTAAQEAHVRSWDATAEDFLNCCQEGLSASGSLRSTLCMEE